MLSRIGIILVIFYFALFGLAFQVVGVDYPLPYPGMLPDNPLYFLKVVRDRAVTLVIRDPVKKGFYLLLLSDKRVAAGKMLLEKGKEGVGATTMIKAQDYFDQAVDIAAKQRNEDLLMKLAVAGAKHEEILATFNVHLARQNNAKSLDRVLKLLVEK